MPINVLEQLNEMGCEAIQIRCYECINIDLLDNFLMSALKSRIRCFDLVLKYSSEYTDEYFNMLCFKHGRIRSITCHSAAQDSASLISKTNTKLFFYKEEITDHSFCGKIGPEFFTLNLTLFTEAQHYNTCLNRKISIDAEGNIRNCPSMKTCFGNIRDTKLADVIKRPDFNRLWYITKDQTETCKICEYRYVCTDCRAFLDEGEELAKPVKCSYNPFTLSWEN